MLKIAHDPTAGKPAELDERVIDLDELCRIAATQMLAVALEAERRAYLDAHAEVLDDAGRRLVVGNGYARPRDVMTGAGMVEATAPRVEDRRPGERFSSAILPPYMRRSPKVTEVLPILYLRGLSTGDFSPALSAFFGSGAGLSASTVQRLTEAWQAEHEQWSKRTLRDVDYVYLWVDGIVRHEAPCNRAVMKGHRLRPVAAGRRSWGQPDLGGAGKGGKQPRQRRDGPAPPDDPGPASETGRCTSAETSGGTPSSERHRLEPGGSGPGSSARSS